MNHLPVSSTGVTIATVLSFSSAAFSTEVPPTVEPATVETPPGRELSAPLAPPAPVQSSAPAAAPMPPPASISAHPLVALSGGTSLTLDAQLRPRVVAHTGRDFVDATKADQVYVTQRARLGVELRAESGLAVVVQLQDVRAWGEEDHPLNDADGNAIDAHQAHVSVPLGTLATLRLGRQELAFDNQRLVGAVNWRQTGQSFDAGRLMLKTETLDADVFLAVIRESAHKGNIDAHFDQPATDDVLFGGLHAHGKLNESFELAGSYLVRKNDAIEEFRHTAGLIAQLAAGGFTGSIEAYGQVGSMELDIDGDGKPATESLGAWMAGLRAGYDLGGDLAPTVQLFADALSGKSGHPEKVFDTLYATNHGFYGELDYFLALPKDAGGLGLLDAGARAGLSPVKGLTTTVAWHLFRSMDDGPDDARAFGQEVDARADWKAMPGLSVGLLYGVFLPGELMQGLRGITDEGDLKAEHAMYLTTDASF